MSDPNNQEVADDTLQRVVAEAEAVAAKEAEEIRTEVLVGAASRAPKNDVEVSNSSTTTAKGKGVFSLRSFKECEVVFRDQCLFSVSNPKPASAAEDTSSGNGNSLRQRIRARQDFHLITQEFLKLPSKQQGEVVGLAKLDKAIVEEFFHSGPEKVKSEGSDKEKNDAHIAAGVFLLNSFCQDKERMLFGLAARANHSCCPNVYLRVYFHGEKQAWVCDAYAIRDIAEGEEICWNYSQADASFLWAAKTARQQYLAKNHFINPCLCPLCSSGTTTEEKTAATMAICGEDKDAANKEEQDIVKRRVHEEVRRGKMTMALRVLAGEVEKSEQICAKDPESFDDIDARAKAINDAKGAVEETLKAMKEGASEDPLLASTNCLRTKGELYHQLGYLTAQLAECSALRCQCMGKPANMEALNHFVRAKASFAEALKLSCLVHGGAAAKSTGAERDPSAAEGEAPSDAEMHEQYLSAFQDVCKRRIILDKCLKGEI